MTLSFLIATIVVFSVNLLFVLGGIWFAKAAEVDVPKIIVAEVIVCLVMLTWNILALINL